MKKIAGLLLLGTVLLKPFSTKAQTYAESALLFSRLSPAGSARIQAMGGTQVSLGGDYSSALSNPAGLGMFNKSEFTFSPALNFNSTSSTYTNPGNEILGTNGSASKTTFLLPGLSVVFHGKGKGDEGSGFMGGSFGLSINRTNDFNRNFSYHGTNSKTSLIDYFVQDAAAAGDYHQFDPPDGNGNVGYNYEYPTGLAYDSYLIDSTKNTSGNAPYYTSPYYSVLSNDPNNPNDIRRVDQREDVKISGGQTLVNAAYGLNLFDKIYVGGGVGIASISYQSTKRFSESNYSFDLDPSFKPINSVVLTENLKTTGSGLNANFGIIGRPVDFIQLGVSFISPTVQWMNDTYSAALTTDYNNFDPAYYGYTSNPTSGVNTLQADAVPASYRLTTPGRMSAGATVFILKQGFLSADIERVNYGGARYHKSGDDLTDHSADNSDIKTMSKVVYNYRFGGEYRFKSFRLRAGYNIMPNPLNATSGSLYDKSLYGYGVSQTITSISGGVGYKSSKFSIDVAIVSKSGNTGYSPYSTYDYNSQALVHTNPSVSTKNTNTLLQFTVGIPIMVGR